MLLLYALESRKVMIGIGRIEVLVSVYVSLLRHQLSC